jgi:CHAT domain-containing protein
LELFLENHPDNKDILKEQATAYQLSGLASEKMARYDEALDYQKKALALFQALNQIPQSALGIQYLANNYWQMGNYRQALSHQKRALELFQQLKNDKLLIMAYGTQGLIEMSLGNLGEAKKSEKTALQLTEKKPNLVEDRATILKNLGLIAIQERDLEQAIVYFLKANQIDSTIGYRRGVAYDARNIGNILIQRDRPDAGVKHLKRGLDISLSIGDLRNVVQCCYGLGMAYHQLNQTAMALTMLDSGLSVISGLVLPELHWRLLRQRAQVFEMRGQKEAALLDLEKAIHIVEAMRAELRVEAFKQGFFDTKTDLYVDAVHLLLKMKNPEKAFDFVERAKSRNFVDMLGNQKVDLSKDQGEFLENEKKASLAIEEAQNRIASFSDIKSPLTKTQQDEKTFWEDQLEERRKAYASLMVTLQSENPELASFVSVDPWESEKLQRLLPDSTLLLEFFLTPKFLFSWTVTQTNVTCRKIDFQDDEIHNLVVAFRQTIQAYLSADVESRALYEKCITPIENELKDVRHIIIIPHGILHYLPFTALQNSDGLYLIDRFSMSLAPSATVLGYCLEKEDALSPKATGNRILALSNPDLGNPSYDLPFAEKEVKSLNRTFTNVDVFFGDKARESVLNNMNRFDLIHFACHGEYQPETPLFSALLLSPEAGFDGRLEAHEIFGLDLQCDLVTLSACETGLAQITKGDEIIGLARSFIFAGSPSIITSLWKVDDLATAVMVKRFYRYLHSGETKGEALRKAQLLVKERVNSHPSAWAAFTLTGGFGKLSNN